MTDEQLLTNVVVEEYLATEQASDAATIAKALGWSESKVRRLIANNGGAPRGCRASKEARATYSRSYPGMQHGAKHVLVYLPELDTLRAMVLEARAAERS